MWKVDFTDSPLYGRLLSPQFCLCIIYMKTLICYRIFQKGRSIGQTKGMWMCTSLDKEHGKPHVLEWNLYSRWRSRCHGIKMDIFGKAHPKCTWRLQSPTTRPTQAEEKEVDQIKYIFWKIYFNFDKKLQMYTLGFDCFIFKPRLCYNFICLP